MRIDLTRMRVVAMRIGMVAVGALLLGGLTACEMKVVPLSVQAGSTIAVPLGSGAVLDQFGYGQDPSNPYAIIDYQRGQLFLKLDTDFDPTNGAQCPEDPPNDPPCEIFARATSAAVGAESSYAAISGASEARQVVGIFDIPPDALPGTYGLILYRELLDEDDPVNNPPTEEELQLTGWPLGPVQRSLTILPNGLDPDTNWANWVACGGAGEPTCETDAIIGAPTPFDYWSSGKAGSLWNDGSYFSYVPYPSPQFVFGVGQGIAALEVDIDYSPTQINVIDVVALADWSTPANKRPLIVWSEDDAGTVAVKAIAQPGELQIMRIGLVFDLVLHPTTGAFTRLTPDDFTDKITVWVATDEDGDPIVPTPTIYPLGVL